MEICDDQTNSVLNQVDAFRSSWISTNEKLRDANSRIESLEAELSIMKNQLYKTTYQRDILNYTLKQLYGTLRADCKVIDQVQRNLSSFVRVAEQDSPFGSPEQNTIQNLLGLNPITAVESNASNSSEHSQVNSSILNKRDDSPRAKYNKPKVNFAKELGLVTLSSGISTRKTSTLSNVSDQTPISSQRNRSRSRGTAMLYDALSSVNGSVTPAVNNKRRSRKLNNVDPRILSRGRKLDRRSNDDVCDVIVIDYGAESEAVSTKFSDINAARDIQSVDADNYLSPDSSTFPNKKAEENDSNWVKTVDFNNEANVIQQEDGNDASGSNNSTFPTEEINVENGSNPVKTADSNNAGDVQQGAENNNSSSNDLICIISSDEADHQEDEDNCSCLNEPNDTSASLPAGVETADEDGGSNSNMQASLDSLAANAEDGGDNLSSQNTPSTVCSNSNEQDSHGSIVHTQNEGNVLTANTQLSIPTEPISKFPTPYILLSPISELENIVFAAKNDARVSTQKRSHQNEDVEIKTRKRKKIAQVAKPRKEKGNPKKSRKSLESSPFVLELQSTNKSSLASSATVSKLTKNKSVSKKNSVPKKKKVSQHTNLAHADDENAWKCQVCGFVTSTSSSLSGHVRRVCYKKLTTENGTCLVCQKENPAVPNYIAKSALDVHILNNHPDPYPDYLRCPYGNGKCIQHFTSLDAHDKHVQSVHKNEDLSLPFEKIFPGQEFWTCANCGKIFFRSAHLIQHAIQAHPGNRKVFSCGLCDFVTAHPTRLQTHSNKHSSDNYKKKGNGNETGKQ
ncbi:rho GTPase-activating protein gacU-like isoform X2 [Planococcus citri]|uniref:rho GTPase-activating protein gacU-like isoform X2 n=1 Tax=Planococcus citri TaxID=170843 RepID=UPI0031F8E392